MSTSAERTTETPQPQSKRLYTFDELQVEFSESNQPLELWDGEMIMAPAPSFRHQEIALAFYRRLHDWVTQRSLGKVIAAPIDMVLSPHRAVQPDVAYISKNRLGIIQNQIRGAADLVCEVISLGTRQRDRPRKRMRVANAVERAWGTAHRPPLPADLLLHPSQSIQTMLQRTIRPGQVISSQ
jgi:Uma2 family endonuclease